MTENSSFGEDYLQSYATIPGEFVEDNYLASKKLGGHRRLFRPGDFDSEQKWFEENLNALVRAYGSERLINFFQDNWLDENLPEWFNTFASESFDER